MTYNVFGGTLNPAQSNPIGAITSRLEVRRQVKLTSRSQPVLAPTSQIRAGRGILLSPMDQLREGMSRLPSIVLYPPKESDQPVRPEPEIESPMMSPRCW